MRIGINGLLLSSGSTYRRTGVSRYVESLLAHLPAETGADELLAYVDRDLECALPGISWRRTPIAVRHPIARIGWELTALPLLARRDRLDVFHGTVNVIPAGIGIPTVVTVHDLAFLRYPEQITRKRYLYLRRMISTSAKRANAVIVPSAASGHDVVQLLGIRPEKITVVPLGVSPMFQPASADQIDRVRQKYKLERPYVLSVGTIEPRKNLPRLIQAIAMIQSEIAEDLVLAGPTGWLTGEIEEAIARSGLGDRIRRPGYTDDTDLVALYSGASVVVMPSLYEGFGLPVLEAMATGAAVVTSNVSSLPEVAGEAAVLVDPISVESIASGIRSVIDDSALRTKLRGNAIERARQFTWARTACETVAVYRGIAR